MQRCRPRAICFWLRPWPWLWLPSSYPPASGLPTSTTSSTRAVYVDALVESLSLTMREFPTRQDEQVAGSVMSPQHRARPPRARRGAGPKGHPSSRTWPWPRSSSPTSQTQLRSSQTFHAQAHPRRRLLPRQPRPRHAGPVAHRLPRHAAHAPARMQSGHRLLRSPLRHRHPSRNSCLLLHPSDIRTAAIADDNVLFDTEVLYFAVVEAGGIRDWGDPRTPTPASLVPG